MIDEIESQAKIAAMDDPTLLEEMRRVRDTVAGLTDRLAMLNREFDRRAAAEWTKEHVGGI